MQNAKTHNSVLIIMTVACLGAVVESITQGWEYWVPPLIIGGLIAAWGFHLAQYSSMVFRENYYLSFSLMVAFYHGAHESSFFDVVVVSMLLMVTVTLLKRIGFLRLTLAEFFIVMLMQIGLAIEKKTIDFDLLTVSRILLHAVIAFCVYKALGVIIKSNRADTEELELRNKEKETEKTEMEDFLVNISHELRTPVNVINGLSSLILKKEYSDDVASIRDAGIMLSRHIEDIQDFSEIARGDVHLEIDKYMITSVVNDLMVDQYLAERRNNLDLIIDIDPNIPAVLRGDSGKISKIIRHLLSNSFKFTRRGGVLLRITSVKHDYGVNLIIEVTDTGAGMSASEIDKVSRGLYQANTKRNRSTGGIGLGLNIVYGFVRKMNGFVKIESEKKKGTMVRVSIAQETVDSTPCLGVDNERFINIAFHVIPEKYKIAAVREFYKNLATNLASGLRLNLYSAPTFKELQKLLERGNITHVFMGAEEYKAEASFFDDLAKKDVTVAVSADADFKITPGNKVILMPKPLYSLTVVRILSGDKRSVQVAGGIDERRPVLDGKKALIVDDEPMNLVVASGLFKDYNMVVDTAESGKEAIEKFRKNDYDVVFMDHMMPEMDGVEAMRKIREVASEQDKPARVIALTANAISGAREMFLREGFDGFISKPIRIVDFERTINKVMPNPGSGREGGRA